MPGIALRVLLVLAAIGNLQAPLFAQAYSKMEVGVQGASLTFFDAIQQIREKNGFGTRFTYNVSPFFAWDAEGDFFPTSSGTGTQRGGRAFLALAGPKAGWRRQKTALFLKVRPGVASFSDVVRIKTGDDPNGNPFFIVSGGGHRTHLAMDLGATMEINTSTRTLVRIDVSEMLLRYDDRVYRIPGASGASVTVNGVIGNSLFVSAGVSYRLGSVAEHSFDLQGVRRWEVGGQYGVLTLGRSKVITEGSFEPVSLGDDKGFGGRVTYNFNRWLAMDSVINYFYTNPHDGDSERGGKILQGAFGPKAGFRAQRFGIFGKIRPGFLSYGSVLDNFFPPFPTTRLTHFAVDFGAVLEYYPTRRTMLRFDLGHTRVFYGSTAVVAPDKPPFHGNFVDRGFQDNGMQFMTGFGWRF